MEQWITPPERPQVVDRFPSAHFGLSGGNPCYHSEKSPYLKELAWVSAIAI